jgi:hypothetical protein
MLSNIDDVQSLDSFEEKAALIADLRDVPAMRADNMEKAGQILDILDRVAPELNPVEYLLNQVI